MAFRRGASTAFWSSFFSTGNALASYFSKGKKERDQLRYRNTKFQPCTRWIKEGNLLLGLKELALGLLLAPLHLLGEVLVVKLVNVDSRNINLRGGAYDISLVHSPQRNPVDLEWSCRRRKKRVRKWFTSVKKWGFLEENETFFVTFPSDKCLNSHHDQWMEFLRLVVNLHITGKN